MMDQHAPIASYIIPRPRLLDSTPPRQHAQGENITSGLRLKNVRYTVLTREEAVDASSARMARGTDMNFWKGLLKQIAKCSLLTDGKRKRQGDGKVPEYCAPSFRRYSDHRPRPRIWETFSGNERKTNFGGNVGREWNIAAWALNEKCLSGIVISFLIIWKYLLNLEDLEERV